MAAYDTNRPRPRLSYFDLFEGARELIRGKYWLFCGIAVVGYLIAAFVPLMICLGPMTCGIMYTFRKQQHGENVEFVDLFRGFDWFLPSLLVSLAKFGITLVFAAAWMVVFFIVMLGIEESHISSDEEAMALVMMMVSFYPLLLVPLLLIEMGFLYAFPLIADRGLQAGEAMGESWRACWQNPWGTFKIAFLNGLLWILASLCCFFPLFLVLPFTYGVIWLGYREIFGAPPADASPGDPLH